MSLDQSGFIGGLQADAFHARQDLLHQTVQTNKAKDALIDHQNINANLGTNNQALMNGNAMLADKNRKLEKMLARPLMEILNENANLKQTLEEQKQLIALWMVRQRAMKNVAIDYAKKTGATTEEVVLKAKKTQLDVVTNNDNLDGQITKESMEYFAHHKNYLLKNSKL